MFRLLRSGYLRRWLRYNAVQRGLLGGRKPWMAVLGLGLVARMLRSVSKRGPMPVRFSERLEPGASYVISHVAPSRPSRWRARRSSKT